MGFYGTLAKKLVSGVGHAGLTGLELADRAALLGAKGAWKATKGAYKLIRPSGVSGKTGKLMLPIGLASAPLLIGAVDQVDAPMLQPLNTEYMKGLRRMQKYSSVRMTEPTVKTAGRGALGSFVRFVADRSIPDMARSVWKWIQKNPSAAKKVGIGLGIGGLGATAAYEVMDRPADTASYLVSKKTFPLLSRVRADETFAEEFFKTLGKETARRSLNIATGVVQQGATAAQRAVGKIHQKNIVNSLMKSDDIISRADPDIISSAMDTMSKFAPTLSTDPNAVRSFLREAVTYGTGPDYATISNLSGAENRVSVTNIPNFGPVGGGH